MIRSNGAETDVTLDSISASEEGKSMGRERDR